MTSTVYVVHEPRRLDKTTQTWRQVHDVRPAEEFGELKWLVAGGQAVHDPVALVEQLTEGLQGFQATDYLLPIGDPKLIAMAAAIAARRTDGSLNLLEWRGAERRYRVVKTRLWCADPVGLAQVMGVA